MNIGKYVPTVATLIVAAVVMAGVAFPMIGNLSAETTTISNDGASWIRMAYITDQSDYSVEYTFGDNISVAGQSGEWGDMILYADSQCTICIVGDNLVLIVGDVAYVSDDPQPVTVSRSNGIVSIDGEPVSESPVSWAYVPVANGKYGSFGADTVPLHRDASNLAVVGGFTGVYAYNDAVSQDYGLIMDADVTEEYINSVRWALESDIPVEETQPFHPINPGMFDPGILNPGTDEPAVIDDPFDPSTLEPQYIDPDIGGNMIMSVPTPTYTDGYWGFNIDGTNVRIVSYSGPGGDIVVPSTLTSGGVTYTPNYFGIGNASSPVFDNANISDFTLTFPGMTISNYACQGCTHLTAITINGLSASGIGIAAFDGCTGLQSVTTSLTTLPQITDGAFRGCTSLSTFPFEKITYLGSNAFTNCTSLPANINLSGLTSGIGGAFNDCTSIKTVVIGSSGKSVSGTFRGCTSLESITFNNNLTDSYTRNVVNGCTSLTTVIFNGSVTGLGDDAFRNCTSLTTITIPATVTKIGSSTFANSGLTSVSLPNSVTSIGGSAFSGCTSLTSVVLPQNITSLNNSTFYGCTSLSSISIPESVTTIGTNVFQNCVSLTGTLVLGSNLTTISGYAFQNTGYENLIVLSDATPNANAFTGTSIAQVLNLGSAEYTTTSYGLEADEVRSDIAATSYMAPVSISETTTREGPTFDLLAILPIVFVAGLLLTTAWLFIRK